MTPLEELKLILREDDCPFFTDKELNYWLATEGSVRAAAYICLLRKSENTSLQISGFSASDSSSYFRRMAQKYRPNNSGVLKST